MQRSRVRFSGKKFSLFLVTGEVLLICIKMAGDFLIPSSTDHATNFTFIVHSSFVECSFVCNFTSWQHGSQNLPVQMYVSFMVIIHWKLNVEIHTFFYYRPQLMYYGAILFLLYFFQISLVFYLYWTILLMFYNE